MTKPPFPPRRNSTPGSKPGTKPSGAQRFGKYPPPPVRHHNAPSATTQGTVPRGSGHVANPDNDIIHGIHAAAAALANPARKALHLWATDNGLARLKELGAAMAITPEIVHPRILDHMLTGQDAVHQGVILEAEPLRQPRLDEVRHDGLIVMLDQVTDPHNVGAILRSCAAFGVAALVTTARHAPAETGVFFKAASGAYEHVPVVRVTNLARAMAELKSYGFSVVGLDSEAGNAMDAMVAKRPLALVLGAEGKGLRQKTAQACDVVARLDMPGAIKSLNVSVAAAVSLYALTH